MLSIICSYLTQADSIACMAHTSVLLSIQQVLGSFSSLIPASKDAIKARLGSSAILCVVLLVIAFAIHRLLKKVAIVAIILAIVLFATGAISSVIAAIRGFSGNATDNTQVGRYSVECNIDGGM